MISRGVSQPQTCCDSVREGDDYYVDLSKSDTSTYNTMSSCYCKVNLCFLKHLLKDAWPAEQDMMAKYKHNTVHVPPCFTCRKLSLKKKTPHCLMISGKNTF